ncbi:hypothetical protein B296_00027994 [Ensete ventricosum]|uniref:Uncharacterized protein n=1 Tax=Ensete ventricosum TaxID=4639 RepID=A0A426YR37_ENSVE|nr:hypothetical protein B296_00027994 [Ensete ventricosum]
MCVRGRIAGLIMTGAIELQPNDRPRSSLDIGPGLDDVVRPRWEFARRFTEGIRKLTRNTLGDRRKKTIGLAIRMPEATELSGMDEPLRSGGGRLTRYGTVPFGGGRTCDEGWVWVWGAACLPLLWRGVTPAGPGLLSGGVGLVAT